MKNILISIILISVSYLSFSQQQKPITELYLKSGYGLVYEPYNGHIVNTQLSFYLNTFGHGGDCDDIDSFLGCILINTLMLFSALEFDAGFETGFYDNEFRFIPKAGFFIRPLYYGKAGFALSTKGMSVNMGFSIPLKNNFQLELLYQNLIGVFNNNLYHQSQERVQINLQIPLSNYSGVQKGNKNKKLF